LLKIYPHSEKDPLKLSDRKVGGQLAFMVRIGETCTGTLIHRDWVITARHCLKDFDSESDIDENGDMVLDLKTKDWELTIQKPVGGSQIAKENLWGKPVKYQKSKVEGVYGWRNVDKLVMHPGFEGEALSWKGNDFALLKLSPEVLIETSGYIVPICLPTKQDQEFLGDMYVGGYGRRTLPHCVTDGLGPEKYGICGRPTECTKIHRARRCGLSFIYDGVMHKNCIHEETPSSKDPLCKKLLKSLSKTKIKTTTHILSENGEKIIGTCYETKPSKRSKGWCTVRDPMHDENKEPEFEKGWGFCSEDHDQETCNDEVVEEIDLESFPVSQLTKSYCLEELMLNLNIEQPDVTFDEVKPLPKQFCTGRNRSVEYDQDDFVQQNEDGTFKKLKYEPSFRKLLIKKDPKKVFPIDGGPACFGDSGGPAFKIVDSTPVLEGVFSYMLWGTCRGRHEPSYYGRVSDFLDWIYRHVPKKEVCTQSI